MNLKKITVFGSATKNLTDKYHEEGVRLGKILGKRGITLFYGIGDDGMLGALFQGVSQENGSIHGVTTPKLFKRQCKKPSLFKKGEVEIVSNLSTRKFKLFDKGDAIFILPGGWGTIDELSEFAVLIQIQKIKKKPLIFINLSGFWTPFKKQLEKMYKYGAISDEKIDYIAFVNKIEEALPCAEKIYKKIHHKD